MATVLVPGFRVIVKFDGLRTAAMTATKLAAAPRLKRTLRRPEKVDAIARTVDAVARRLPVRSKCLPRSLALWTMLQRAGIDADLRIGMRTDGSGEAHAWIERDGSPIGEQLDADTLAPFSLASQLPAALVGPERPPERAAGPERHPARDAGPERPPAERDAGPERPPAERDAGPERPPAERDAGR